jgi:MerR family mercuric resistance operon transcriptional regulator
MAKHALSLSIGTLAKAAAVNVETIRFYQRKRLLQKPKHGHGQIARYTATDISRVRFIKAAKELGFTLAEVAVLLTLEDGTHCADARDMAQQKLSDVRQKLAALRNMESALEQVVAGCCASKGENFCPLIASLQGSA